jgi:hypothetical protein
MANCVNKSLPEFIELQEDTGLNPHVLAAKIGVWQDKNGTFEFPTRQNLTMNKRLEAGFLKDFNVDVKQYESIKDALGYNSTQMVDLVSKFIAIEEGQSLDKATAYFAFRMLGKENSKLISDLRYRVHAWDKYKEKFEFYKAELFAETGYIKDKRKWIDQVRDKIIVDYLAETIVKYDQNPRAFENNTDRKWTQDDFTFFKQLLRAIKNILGLGLESRGTKQKKLANLGTQIAHEVLTQEYDILNYELKDEQIQKYYEDTVASDQFAKEVVEYHQSQGMVLTGSLALRKAGTVFRTAEETLHDLDFVVPFDLNRAPVNEIVMNDIRRWQGADMNTSSNKTLEYIESLHWFSNFKLAYPSYKLIRGFYGSEHGNFESFTVTGVVEGEYYDKNGTHDEVQNDGTTKTVKHKKGEWIKDTGYIVDHFVRLEPQQEEHEDYFKLWKEIMIAKLKMNRAKDLTDFKHFVPFTKSKDSFNFYYDEWVYQAGNTAIRGKKELTLKEQLEESPLSKEAQEIEKMDSFIGEFIQRLKTNLGLTDDQIEQITEDEARELTIDAINPWQGQAGFYYKGKVYLIKGRIDYSTAFHEFAHPLVRAIAADNNKLFNKIFDDIVATPQGQIFLQEALAEYPNLTSIKNPDLIKEEVIVKAMTYVAMNEGSANIEAKPSNALVAAIKKLIYAIKQALRKIGGKGIDPKDLSINTTAEDLANMMLNDTWNINLSTIKESDIVAYLGDKEKALKALTDKVDKSASLNIYNAMMKARSEQLLEMEKAEAWSDIIDVLAINEEQTHTLKAKDALRGLGRRREVELDQELKAEQEKALEGVTDKEEQAKILIAINKKEDDFFKARIRAVYDNLVEAEVEANKINEHLGFLADEPDQQAAFAQLEIYKLHLQASWEMLTAFDNQLEEGGIPSESGGIRGDIASIKQSITDAKKSIKRIYSAAVSETLSEKFNTGMSAQVKKFKDQQARWRNDIQKRPRDKAHLEQRIADNQEKIDRLLTTPEVMLEYLMGQRGDINQWSMQLENFIASQDKAISSFANYIKDNNSKVRVQIHQGRNHLLREMNKYLDELGVRPDQVIKFSEEFLFKDVTTKRNPDTGEIEDYTVQTLLNPWQNFKRDQGLLQTAEEEAYRKWKDDSSDKNSKALSDIVALTRAHTKFFFKGRFVDEYYHADDDLLAATYDRKDENGKVIETIKIGEIAKQEAKEKYEVVLQFQNIDDFDQDVDIRTNFGTVEAALAEYRKLFSLVDDYGNRKEGEALRKAELLIENRAKKRVFHEFVPIRNAFENALKGEEYMIRAELAKNPEQFPNESPEYKEELERRLQLWIADNTRFKAKDDFYTLRTNLYDQLNEIMSKVKDDTLSEDRELLLNTLQGRKDDDGQPIGTEMTQQLLDSIKEIQQTLIDAQALQPKLKDLGLDKDEIDTVVAIFGALQNLQKTEATTYYLEIINAHYRRIRKEEGELNPDPITLEDVDEKFSDPAFVKTLKGKSAEFDKWFDDNHILRTKKTGRKTTKQVYERIKAWSVTKPQQAEHVETTKIYDEKGELKRTIEGLPKMMYYNRQVKPKYVTGYNEATGKVDPYGRFTNQGFQIPKSLEEMKAVQETYSDELIEHNKKIKEVLGAAIPIDHYVNHAYFDLKKQDNARFKLLEVFRKFHHASQEGLDKNKTLGDELPRIRRDNYLYLKSGDAADDAIEKVKMIGTGVAQLAGDKADDPESGRNWREQEITAGAQVFSTERPTQIPIRGRYNLPINQVAPDVLQALFIYYQSAEQNKMLTSMQPLASAMQDLANENVPVEMKRINREKIANMEKSAIRSDLVSTGKPGESNNRAKLIDGMVKVLFEGKTLEETHDKRSTVKWVNAAMGVAAHSFFALDMTSALKNFYGAQFQIALEAAGGKYYGYKSWQAGRPWAVKAMAMVSKDIYAQDAKTLEVQIIDIFDAIQGRFEDKFGESPSRSIQRDTASLSWMTSTRKWLETEATLQIFSAIMRDTKVKQTVNGKETEINYIDAWELDNFGHIKLKDGIDKKWDMGGEMFLKITNMNHETSNFLQGMYSKADKPLINRHIAYRLFGSLKNYFAKMFIHRYAAGGLSLTSPSTWLHPEERVNLATGQMHLGYYWGFVSGIVKTLESRGKHLSSMTKDEKRDLYMAPLDLLKQWIIGYLLTMLYQSFGTDEDDSKRWSKIARQTGALPTPYTNPKYAARFNTYNWMKAHIMLTLMNVQSEANAFSPSKKAGINHMYSTIAMENAIAMKASFAQIKDLLQSIFSEIQDKPGARYKKDASALKMKQKGTPKFVSKLYKLGWHPYAPFIPVSGKAIDPVTSLKNMEGFNE